ncbi:hypothetical protein SKAU_G00380080 [Synaphobranchus kaupii]|uniref:Uncharacterized protein n=1 Tax=Synaphobranchus kaupii TaxID=118154 RepID=A0A9Q1EDH1_SYNKA|nr:hypothetical protein SKAU_G00380080 [Synaphobranchus kaupii]
MLLFCGIRGSSCLFPCLSLLHTKWKEQNRLIPEDTQGPYETMPCVSRKLHTASEVASQASHFPVGVRAGRRKRQDGRPGNSLDALTAWRLGQTGICKPEHVK